MHSNPTWLKFTNLAVLLVFILALLSGCASGPPPQSAPNKEQVAQDQPAAQAPAPTQQPPTTSAPATVRAIQATVTSVSNGDTVHVNRKGRDERMRMIGVNCPEISHPDLGIREQSFGLEAKEYTERQLRRKVWLELEVQ